MIEYKLWRRKPCLAKILEKKKSILYRKNSNYKKETSANQTKQAPIIVDIKNIINIFLNKKLYYDQIDLLKKSFIISKIKKMRIKSKIASIVLLMILLLFAFIYCLINSSVMIIKNIEIHGNKNVKTEDIKSRLKSLEGIHLAKITKDNVLKGVSDLKQIQTIDIHTKTPHTLIVDIIEHPEIALIKKNNQEFLVVDPNGLELRTIKRREDAKIPLLDGGQQIINNKNFPIISRIISLLPKDILRQINKIKVQNKESIVLILNNGAKVYWGDGSNSFLKSEILKILIQKTISSSVKEYDITLPTHPVTREGKLKIDLIDPQPIDMPYSDGSIAGSQSMYNKQVNIP